jgi:hypothetical protein
LINQALATPKIFFFYRKRNSNGTWSGNRRQRRGPRVPDRGTLEPTRCCWCAKRSPGCEGPTNQGFNFCWAKLNHRMHLPPPPQIWKQMQRFNSAHVHMKGQGAHLQFFIFYHFTFFKLRSTIEQMPALVHTIQRRGSFLKLAWAQVRAYAPCRHQPG